jgi:hypothetical protein
MTRLFEKMKPGKVVSAPEKFATIGQPRSIEPDARVGPEARTRQTTGRIEIPDGSEPELMLVHVGLSGVPKGREIVVRRQD